MTGSSPDPIPAATLIVFRDAAHGGPPELLMVERASTMAFAAGAVVFPGGRVDPGDRALAERLGSSDPDDAAARIAAIRETIEEVGLPLGLRPPPDPAILGSLRAAVHAGRPFAEALDGTEATLDLALLEPFVRWRPDQPGIRNFDTRFYLARLPLDAPEPRVDATENVRLFWASAGAILAAAEAGRVTLLFPTRRNLERLALFADHDAAVAAARTHPARTITPWIENRDGAPHLCIPTDLGYPIAAEPLATVRRR